jgi:hypothetical protein
MRTEAISYERVLNIAERIRPNNSESISLGLIPTKVPKLSQDFS